MNKDFNLIGSGIYSIINEISGKMYIGSACNLANRYRGHLHGLVNNKHHSKQMQNSFNKHGSDVFTFNVIKLVVDKSKLLEREQVWIDFFKPEFNSCQKAGSRFGSKPSEETKRKISKSKRDATTPEYRASLSRAFKGRVVSTETRLKLSKSLTGLKKSESARESMMKSRPEYGTSSKVVVNIESGVFYDSIKLAWQSYGDTQALPNFGRKIRGRQYNDTPFRYADQMLISKDALNKEKQAREEECKEFRQGNMVVNTESGIFYESAKSAWESYVKNITLTSFNRKLRGEQKQDIPFIYA